MIELFKKIVGLCAAVALTLVNFCNVYSETVESDSLVVFNGSYLKFDVPLHTDVETGRLLMPLRPVLEALGVDAEGIYYDPDSQFVSFKNFLGNNISFYLESLIGTVNGINRWVDTPARLIDDYVYVPLRFVCEYLGASVKWNEVENAVIITLE